VVPYLVYGDQTVTGYDPDGLDRIARAYHSTALVAS